MSYMLRSSSTRLSARSWTMLSTTWPLSERQQGAVLCPSKTEVCFSLWYLCSRFLPPGLTLQAAICCDCDCVTEIKTGVLIFMPSYFIFPTCRSWAVVAVVPLMWVVQMKSSFQKEKYAQAIILWWHENKSQFGTSSQTLYLPVTVFP